MRARTALAPANRVAVVGAAATPVGRLAPRQGETANAFEHDVLLDVVREALESAGIGAEQIGSAVFTLPPGNTPQLGFATFFCSQLGLKLTGQIAEVVEMGITGGLAFDQACADVQLGRAEFAMALGVSFQTATPRADAMEQSIRVVGDIDFQAPFGLTPISWYALDAARYMHETGATREDLAAIAVKSRRHARGNSRAQFREALTIEDVITARPIVEPLGLLDVPAVADGAVCLIVAQEQAARELGVPYITVAGRGFYHEGYHQIGDVPADITAFPAAKTSADTAMAQAQIDLSDCDLAEIYAPCTITEILVTEALGVCARGQGGPAARDGLTALGGELPVNTSGGCLARGHPPSLTALYGLLEIYEQLLDRSGSRQVESARLGMHICELGNYNAAIAHVLEGPQ